MGQAVQMNTRIDAELKRQGDAVFARNHISPSSAVRMLWAYTAQHGMVPDFMGEAKNESDAKADTINGGMGLAFRALVGKGAASAPGASLPLDYVALRDEAYDAMLDELEENHA